EQTAVDLQLRDRTDADADADRRNPPEVAVEAGHGIVLVVRVVDAALDQHPSRAHRLRILGDKRPLLRLRCAQRQKAKGKRQKQSYKSQKRLRLSNSTVTGP